MLAYAHSFLQPFYFLHDFTSWRRGSWSSFLGHWPPELNDWSVGQVKTGAAGLRELPRKKEKMVEKFSWHTKVSNDELESLSLPFIPNKSIFYFLDPFQDTQKSCMHRYFGFFLFTETKANQPNKHRSIMLCTALSFAFVPPKKQSWQSLPPRPRRCPAFFDNRTPSDSQMIWGNDNLRTATLASLSYSPPKVCPVSSTHCCVSGDNSWEHLSCQQTCYLSQATEYLGLLRAPKGSVSLGSLGIMAGPVQKLLDLRWEEEKILIFRPPPLCHLLDC